LLPHIGKKIEGHSPPEAKRCAMRDAAIWNNAGYVHWLPCNHILILRYIESLRGIHERAIEEALKGTADAKDYSNRTSSLT